MFSLYSNVNNFHPTCFFSQLNWGVSVDCCAVWCTLGDLELTSVILKISVKKNIFLNMTDNPNELPQNEVLWQTICYLYIFYSYDKTIPVSAIPLKPKQSPITFKIRDWMRNDWEHWNELDRTWNATRYTQSNLNIRNGMCSNKASSHDWNKKTLDSINLKAETLFFSWQEHPCSPRN